MNNLKIYKFFFLLIFLILISSLCLSYIFNPELILLILALLITFTFLIPIFIEKRINLFSIWSFVFYSVFFGVFLRCLYIVFDIPNIKRIDQVFLLGENKFFLIPAMFLILFGSFFLVGGYLFSNKKLKLNYLIFTNDHWIEKKVFRATIFITIVSLLSLVIFVNFHGGLFTIASLSSYRGISTELSELATYSYLRLLISLSGLNVFILYVWIMHSKKRKIISRFLFLISIIIFIFFNFYVSQRSAIVFLFVKLLAISFYYSNFKVPKFKLFLFSIIGLLFFQLMSSIRSNFLSIENQNIEFSVLKSLEPAVLTTNMIDVSKTAHIVDAIPYKLDYQFGYTFTTMFFAWIPRTLWKEKPVTNVDNTIGMKVFGSTTYGTGGVPPGIFAELYWNFSLPGVFLGCFFIGWILKLIHLSFNDFSRSKNSLIIYVVIFMLSGIWLIGSSFSSVLIGVLMNLVPLIFLLNFITDKSKI